MVLKIPMQMELEQQKRLQPVRQVWSAPLQRDEEREEGGRRKEEGGRRK
jgi:hypothetical protein